MATSNGSRLVNGSLNRRHLLGWAAAGLATTSLSPRRSYAAGTAVDLDLSAWTPEYIRSIAGTLEVDTAAECAKVVPLELSRASSPIGMSGRTRPRRRSTTSSMRRVLGGVRQDLSEHQGRRRRTSTTTRCSTSCAPPHWAMRRRWWRGCRSCGASKFAAKGQLHELRPRGCRLPSSEFWPGAMKSVTWKDKTYGVPTNNETMALIWNAAIFQARPGSTPISRPTTWDDLVALFQTDQGKDRQERLWPGGAAPMPATRRSASCRSAGRFGGGALDEAERHPTYKKVLINNDGSKACAAGDRTTCTCATKSVPVSALTNTQTRERGPVLAGQLAMMVGHPIEYAVMLDRAKKATGDDRQDRRRGGGQHALWADAEGAGAPRRGVRRLERAHVQSGGRRRRKLDMDAARAFIAFSTGPEWSTKLAWDTLQPRQLCAASAPKWMKQRLTQIKFLDVTTVDAAGSAFRSRSCRNPPRS